MDELRQRDHLLNLGSDVGGIVDVFAQKEMLEVALDIVMPMPYSQGTALRHSGAFQEIAEIRAAALLDPTKALVSLDVKNAFGSVQWSDALQAVLRRAPKLGKLLALQW